MDNRGDKRPHGSDSVSAVLWTPKKQRSCPSPEKGGAETHIRNAKRIMANIKCKLIMTQNNCEDIPTKKLIQYVREKIAKLDSSVKKKTTVGVFGKTGAGKSSLINALLGEKCLLPSGTLCACTSVIIQVEANMSDSNYTAEISFISKQDWEDELKTLLTVLSEDGEERDSAMFNTANEKITALYGEKGVFTPIEDLMKEENFSGIPEFLRSKNKTIKFEDPSGLSDEIGCYIKHDESSPGGCYWPIVKCVTIKVPNCKDFLEHIVLVDLPGTGDYNKSRDQMWRLKLRECSAVWIVSEINRAGSDKEAWELISNSITDMAQGGECSSISFICTKTDDINPQNYMRSSKLKDEDFQITPQDPQYINKKRNACILHRNTKAKERVRRNFLQQETIQRHFSCDDDFFSVYTVSSEEFTNENPILKLEETEIPKLKNQLRTYNSIHTNEMAGLYISGALGIMSLIQGFNEINTEMMEERSRLYKDLEKDLQTAVEHLQDYCAQICSSLEELLLEGVRESEEKCVKSADEIITPKNKDGRGFHRTLNALCKNDGSYRSKKGLIDLNAHLAKHMYHHIDEAFTDFFRVQGPITEKSLQTHIDKFSIISENLIIKYENHPVLSHMLEFLKNEEIKLKTMFKLDIVEKKKRFYVSLPESIKDTMDPAYKRAALFSGTGSMKKKQDELLKHIESSKSKMFLKAKEDMTEKMENILLSNVREMRTRLLDSMENSLLNANTVSYIDVSKDKEDLKKLLALIESDQ